MSDEHASLSAAPEKSAIEKACDLVASMDGPMSKPCRVCRGGWWIEDGETIAGVHATECPYSGKKADDA